MVVAVIALVIAASGTAVAATQLQNGDSLIKKNSLSGNRLKNRSVTGSKIKLSSLGTVPSATNAVNAQNAQNAATVGGQSPSAFDAASNWTRTAYASTSEGGSTTLAQFGPVVLTLHCSTLDGTPDSYVSVASTQSFATADDQVLKAGGTAPGNLAEASPAFSGDSATSFSDSGPNVNDFTAPGGGLWSGEVIAQTNNPGNGGQCGAFATIQKVH